MPPSCIHCPNDTSKSAYGIPTIIELIINGIIKAPFSFDLEKKETRLDIFYLVLNL